MIQAARKHLKRSKRNLSLKALRNAIGRTQYEFAVMVGVSTETIISWENGRNRLPEDKAQLIHLATGARTDELLSGKGRITNDDGLPYSAADFKRWHDTYLKAPDETKAEYFSKLASIMLWLVFHAAAKPGSGKLKNRLPGAWLSFSHWTEQAVTNFKLKPQIEELRRHHKKVLRERANQAFAIIPSDIFKV